MLQNLEAGDFGKVQIDDDDVGQACPVHLREGLDGFLAVIAALNLGRDAMRSEGFFQQEHVRVVIFDDENLRRLA